jgi:hypothetical protein
MHSSAFLSDSESLLVSMVLLMIWGVYDTVGWAIFGVNLAQLTAIIA